MATRQRPILKVVVNNDATIKRVHSTFDTLIQKLGQNLMQVQEGEALVRELKAHTKALSIEALKFIEDFSDHIKVEPSMKRELQRLAGVEAPPLDTRGFAENWNKAVEKPISCGRTELEISPSEDSPLPQSD
jgi:hypothetical protein